MPDASAVFNLIVGLVTAIGVLAVAIATIVKFFAEKKDGKNDRATRLEQCRECAEQHTELLGKVQAVQVTTNDVKQVLVDRSKTFNEWDKLLAIMKNEIDQISKGG